MKSIFKLVGAIVLCQFIGLLGTIFTAPAIPSWYATLQKPWFSPPNWLFGPVWTLLYLLMGISLHLIWKKGFTKKNQRALQWFFGQLFLNFLWSLLFFGLHSPLLGLVGIAALLIAIVMTMVTFYPLSKTSTYLLVPYLCWVSFATVLNAAVFMLN